MAHRRNQDERDLVSVELFTGAGGLAMGTALAGFAHRSVIEWNPDACNTLRANSARVRFMADWQIQEADVRDIRFRELSRRNRFARCGCSVPTILIGWQAQGVRRQPQHVPRGFSRGTRDSPESGNCRERQRSATVLVSRIFRLHSRCTPRSRPCSEAGRVLGVAQRKAEASCESCGHEPHQVSSTSSAAKRCRFRFAAAPRARVHCCGSRGRGCEMAGPFADPQRGCLAVRSMGQWQLWRAHGVAQPKTPEALRVRVDRLWAQGRPMFTERWRTVRDALVGLPEPVDYKEHSSITNHAGNPGARAYPGHTGSPLDEPAKTLKAGDHGVPGGENMLRYSNGRVRYFTVREAARLQAFPDDYRFSGAWSECLRQLGNAVPVDLARAVAASVKSILENSRSRRIRVVA